MEAMQEAATQERSSKGRDSAGRRPIRALDPLIVNQIAAGEVIERPASVVKELVDNAIDAGATRIRVELEKGGIELIRVTDDGCGMPPEDLPLAIAPHATSKLVSAEELTHIATMGFRGEAMASIASIARLAIRSRAEGAESASLIEVNGGEVVGGSAGEAVRPAAGALGTLVTVRNLFYNTPARRKFLRTPVTEQTRCADVIKTLAIARPAMGFTLVGDGKVKLDLPPDQSPRERALDILGRELESELLEVHADEFDAKGASSAGLALWGLIGLPSIARATNKSQLILVNGRPIRDKTIQHAIKEGFRGLIEPSRHPTAVLMIEMDPGAVDVNVHPAKAEVRFRDGSLIHSVVLRAVRDALRNADLTPMIGGSAFGRGFIGDREVLPTERGDDRGAKTVDGFVDSFMKPATSQGHSGRLSYDELRRALEPERQREDQTTDAQRSDQQQRTQHATHAPHANDPPHAEDSQTNAPHLTTPRPASRVLQVHNSYLVTQDQDGVVIIDQHALHERAMFELLLQRIEREPLESQRLLAPAVLDATSERIEALDALADLLSKIGVDAEPSGPRSIAVHAFPTFLFDRGVEPQSFLAELLDRAGELTDERETSESALHEVLDMMACKAAVKAGDRMSETELTALVDLREGIERASSCPHGRPTSVRLTIKQLEKLFHRT